MRTYLESSDIELMELAASCLRDKLLIRLLFRLGCRVSEALALKVIDIDFEQATVTILHLKTRIRLSCPKCKARLGKRHQFCPGCGEEVNEATKRHQEHRCIRVLPVDKPTLEMHCDCFRSIWAMPVSIRQQSIERLPVKSIVGGMITCGTELALISNFSSLCYLSCTSWTIVR